MKKTLIYFSACLFFLASCRKDSFNTGTRAITGSSKKYVTSLFEYQPAPGQFINTGTGDSMAAKSILGNRDHVVSLGAWGGYIVLGFDHTVINKPDTADIMVYGNAFITLAEPGVVYVMADENKNEKPDDTWYELAGSENGKTGYQKNYSVTYNRPASPNGNISWHDNMGNSGTIDSNSFHPQPIFPGWIIGDSYILTGTLLPHNNIDASNPAYIISGPLENGYADNTVGGDMLKIENAIDSNGNKVLLSGIDFIKIQTGIQFNLGWLGEFSTEVAGVADISMGLD